VSRQRRSVRDRWVAELSKRLPVGQRAMQATLTSIANSEAMSPGGRLSEWQPKLSTKIGVPRRTLQRHLAQATDHDWLLLLTPGGNGRPSVYQAIFPDAKSGAQLGGVVVESDAQLRKVVRHLVAHSVTEAPTRRYDDDATTVDGAVDVSVEPIIGEDAVTAALRLNRHPPAAHRSRSVRTAGAPRALRDHRAAPQPLTRSADDSAERARSAAALNADPALPPPSNHNGRPSRSSPARPGSTGTSPRWKPSHAGTSDADDESENAMIDEEPTP
jgi:hypothetical protein